MFVPAKRDGITSSKAVISRYFCVVFSPFSLVELTFVLFPSKAQIVAYEVEIEAGLFPQPLKQPHPTLRGCASAKFDWMNVRRGL
jgi:hypothetical protein